MYAELSLFFLGDTNRLINEGTEQRYQAKTLISNPKFNVNFTKDYDIGLVELEKPAMFNDHVIPVCLPASGERPAVGSKCFITGNNVN